MNHHFRAALMKPHVRSPALVKYATFGTVRYVGATEAFVVQELAASTVRPAKHKGVVYGGCLEAAILLAALPSPVSHAKDGAFCGPCAPLMLAALPSSVGQAILRATLRGFVTTVFVLAAPASAVRYAAASDAHSELVAAFVLAPIRDSVSSACQGEASATLRCFVTTVLRASEASPVRGAIASPAER